MIILDLEGFGEWGREHAQGLQTTQLESCCSPLLAVGQLPPPSLPRGGLVHQKVPPLDPLCGRATSWVK